MHLTVLALTDCPGVKLLDQRLAVVLQDRHRVTVSHHDVDDPAEAFRLGMHGSPTLLVDGFDPFADLGQRASMSCRLYRHGGQAESAPSIRKLRQAVSNPVIIVADTADGAWLDALGRAGRGRIAPADRGLRRVQQAVLRSFAATGEAPGEEQLDQAAGRFDRRQVLAELADGDFLYLDEDGRITAAYPFSATLTAHTVEIAGGPIVYSMCAIDALGIADMVVARVLIHSADPASGEIISVSVDGESAIWEPDTAVVFVGRAAGACAGPSATVCCGHMNFFTSHSSAAAWASSRPDVTGGILSQAKALEVGQLIFGQLLS